MNERERFLLAAQQYNDGLITLCEFMDTLIVVACDKGEYHTQLHDGITIVSRFREHDGSSKKCKIEMEWR